MSADVDALRAELDRTREVLSRRSAALDRVVGEKRTLEARLENVEALLADWGEWVTLSNQPLDCVGDLARALYAPVPSWRALCPHGGCADPDSCRDAVRADTLGDN